MGNPHFDVFLSHNSADKDAVRRIAEWLREQGVTPWLDEWQLKIGVSIQPDLEANLVKCSAFVVFVGHEGFGPWHAKETRAAIDHQLHAHQPFPVITVLLPSATRETRDKLPLFLKDYLWIEFPSLDDKEALRRLKCGIEGEVPGPASRAEAVTKEREEKIVPHGLRSFTAADSHFFLRLLPGPRTHGLPVSVAFWKEHLEHVDSDDTFRIGLIYGPSGCGKSSLVKAGLLPRLAEYVVPIYLEATPVDTERQLLVHLRKRVSGLPTDLELAASLAFIRENPDVLDGCKLVLILDQLEQWLHGNRVSANAPLIAALRHCDGLRLQAVLMVRTDFSLEIHRFLAELDVRIQEDVNMRLVDLFDLTHSRRVLLEFGRAYGRLPDQGQPTDEQQTFVNQAVTDLSDDKDRLIAVQIALLAHMLRNKDWTASALRKIGGTRRVGRAFLEESFDDPKTASPNCRAHRTAAIAVLKKLLPSRGAELKGTQQTQAALQQVAGYTQRGEEFVDLVHLLSRELCLISPSAVDESETKPIGGTPTYQLTHDYLVPSIQEWLNSVDKRNWFHTALQVGLCVAGLLVAVLMKYIADFYTFQLEFASKDYADQRAEVIITRRLNPFGYRMGTRAFRDDCVDYLAEQSINQRMVLSRGFSPDWTQLERLFSPQWLKSDGEDQLDSGSSWSTRVLDRDFDMGYVSRVNAIAFSPTGDRILLAGPDGMITLAGLDGMRMEKWKRIDFELIHGLSRLIDSTNSSIRVCAAELMVQLGKGNVRVWPLATDATSRIIDLDLSKKPIKVISGASSVIDTLVVLLKDPHRDIRARAAQSLGRLEKSDAAVIDALVALLTDQSIEVRSRAAQSLVTLGKSDPVVMGSLFSFLTDQDSYIRCRAAGSLADLGTTDPIVFDTLFTLLKDESGLIRSVVAKSLGELGERGESVIEVLVTLLNDQHSETRFQAVLSLVKLGRSDAAVIEALVALLKDADSDLRSRVRPVIVQLGKNNRAVVDSLAVLLKEKDSELRSSVALLLAQLGAGSAEVIEALVSLCKDQDHDVRCRAAMSLGELGNSNPAVIGGLVALLQDRFSDVRTSAAESLGKLGKDEAAVISGLVVLLADQVSDVRATAAESLGKLGKNETAVISGLVGLLKDKSRDVRSRAVAALRYVETNDAIVFDELVTLLKDQDRSVRHSAKQVLGQLSQRLVDWSDERMIAGLADFDSDIRERAGIVLAWRDERLNPQTREKIRAMQKDSRPWARQASLHALYHIEKRKAELEEAARQKLAEEAATVP